MRGIIVEADPVECLFCQYGEIPKWAELPYPLCVKHWDIITFVWDKEEIPWQVIGGER